MNAHGQEEIHLAYRIDGREVIACDTNVKPLSACPIRPTTPILRTTETDAVTCFMCRQTEACRKLLADQSKPLKVVR